MTYSRENGFIPQDILSIIEDIRLGVNGEFGTSYTTEIFVGTGWYRFAYQLAQKIQSGQVKTSEIFLKLQEYIKTTNDAIQRPSVSINGIIDSFKDNGWVASVKNNEIGDAGTVSICVDANNTDPDYASKKLEICTFIKDFIAAGMVTIGSEVESITLSNGQSFDFKYSLPTKTPILLKLTCSISENNLLSIPGDEDIRQQIFDAINERYRLGWNFEPQRYYDLSDAPWAESVLLEWSDDDGANYYSTVFDAGFDDLFTFGLEDIEVIIS